MEILQFLLSFFMEEYGGGKFLPIFNALKENSFDLKKTLKNLTPETAAPFLKDVFSGMKKESPSNGSCAGYGLTPISEVADIEIVKTLNKYFRN